MHTAVHGGVFKPSDIERNSVLSYMHDSSKKIPGLVSPQRASRLAIGDFGNDDIKALVTQRRNNQLTGDHAFGKRHYSTIEGI